MALWDGRKGCHFKCSTESMQQPETLTPLFLGRFIARAVYMREQSVKATICVDPTSPKHGPNTTQGFVVGLRGLSIHPSIHLSTTDPILDRGMG